MVDREGRQKAMDKQEDQASLVQSGSILGNSRGWGPFRALHFAERKQS